MSALTEGRWAARAMHILSAVASPLLFPGPAHLGQISGNWLIIVKGAQKPQTEPRDDLTLQKSAAPPGKQSCVNMCMGRRADCLWFAFVFHALQRFPGALAKLALAGSGRQLLRTFLWKAVPPIPRSGWAFVSSLGMGRGWLYVLEKAYRRSLGSWQTRQSRANQGFSCPPV